MKKAYQKQIQRKNAFPQACRVDQLPVKKI